jgi:hypothetical protein
MPEEPRDDFRIRATTVIQLRTPDGRMLDAQIASIQIAKTDRGCRMAIMLPLDTGRQDVPEGTEIWYVPEAHAQASP